MIDTIVRFYLSLPQPARWLIETIGVGWGIKKVLAHRLTVLFLQKISLLEEHETDTLRVIMRHLKSWTFVARKVAIVDHFKHGHSHDDVIGCTEGNCTLFAEPVHPQVA